MSFDLDTFLAKLVAYNSDRVRDSFIEDTIKELEASIGDDEEEAVTDLEVVNKFYNLGLDEVQIMAYTAIAHRAFQRAVNIVDSLQRKARPLSKIADEFVYTEQLRARNEINKIAVFVADGASSLDKVSIEAKEMIRQGTPRFEVVKFLRDRLALSLRESLDLQERLVLEVRLP